MLSKKPMSYSEMLEVLGVSNSFLTYHLENLGELVSKMQDGKYKLSSFGEDAMATMTRVEDIPVNTPHQSPQTKPKKIVWKSVPIALGLICIVLIAFIAYFAVAAISAQNSYNNLQNQNKQLQTWLNGNETLLNQTQVDIKNLQNQIDSLNSNATNLQNQVNNFHIGSTENSTILFNNEIVQTNENVSGVTSENGSISVKQVVGWGWYVPSAGYVSIRVSSNNTSTSVAVINSNGTNIIGGTYQFSVGFGGTVVVPVLPTSWIDIIFGASIGEATLTVTITYYY
jgi:cell division protein FtsB